MCFELHRKVSTGNCPFAALGYLMKLNKLLHYTFISVDSDGFNAVCTEFLP